VIHAVKSLLDSTLNTQAPQDQSLEKELILALAEADAGDLIPYEEVFRPCC
jgi:hypothetical protein